MRKSLAFPAFLAAASLLAVSACQNSGRNENLVYVERPVEALFNQGASMLDNRRYLDAIELFNEVERQHPYSEWARRAQMLSAFASYKTRDYAETVEKANRFVGLHPGSESAPYAYYLIALSYFDQIVDVGRDQSAAENARGAFSELLLRYPDSDYARDAEAKLAMVDNQLAGKDMEVGRWYLRRQQHLPAINRFKNVVDNYDTTSHVPEALHRLVEAYLSVGLRSEAVAAAAVLGHNYPDNEWYQRSYDLLARAGIQ